MTASEIAGLYPPNARNAALLVLTTLRYTQECVNDVYSQRASVESRARNLSDAARQSFRAKLVNQIWESDLRSDLVDRIVFAYDGGYFDVPTLRSAIRRAKSRKADYERSNGMKGKDAIWKTLASWLKGVYESHGVEWTPTASALEPRPEAPAALDEDEILARDAEIRRTRYRNGVILNCEEKE